MSSSTRPRPRDLPRIVAARHVAGYVLRIRLSDGTIVFRDFRRTVDKGVFRPLRDINLFKKVRVKRGVVTWRPARASEVDVDPYNLIWGHFPHAVGERPCAHGIAGKRLVCLRRATLATAQVSQRRSKPVRRRGRAMGQGR
jgi:hypothetical protein